MRMCDCCGKELGFDWYGVRVVLPSREFMALALCADCAVEVRDTIQDLISAKRINLKPTEKESE